MNKNLLAAALGALVIATPVLALAGGPGFGPGFGPGLGAGCPHHGQCPMGDMGPGRMGPGGGIDAHLAMMTARLGLSPEQRDEIRGILEVQQATRQVIDTALREAMREQVDSVLTPDQQAMHARMMAWRDQGGAGMGGPGHCAMGQGIPPRWRPAGQ